MSMTKRSEAYARHMDERFIDEGQYFLDTHDEEYREYLYLQKQHKPAQTAHKNKQDERIDDEQRAPK